MTFNTSSAELCCVPSFISAFFAAGLGFAAAAPPLPAATAPTVVVCKNSLRCIFGLQVKAHLVTTEETPSSAVWGRLAVMPLVISTLSQAIDPAGKITPRSHSCVPRQDWFRRFEDLTLHCFANIKCTECLRCTSLKITSGIRLAACPTLPPGERLHVVRHREAVLRNLHV